MKILKIEEKVMRIGCSFFRHLLFFTVLSMISSQAFSLENKKEGKNLYSRAPASAFDEEVLTVPLEQKVIVKSLFAEDDAGVMKGVRDSLTSWQSTEDYAKRWNLESTHLYKTPTTQEKSKYISTNILRYVDKRFAGEMKNAEEGSTFHTVGKLEEALRPDATVPVSRYISVKFKVRVLEGKAIMEVKNPWVESNATASSNGNVKILTKKDFNKIGMSPGVEYNLKESQWIAFVDQEVTKNIKARVSSTTMPNGNDADKRVEMTASFPFNL